MKKTVCAAVLAAALLTQYAPAAGNAAASQPQTAAAAEPAAAPVLPQPPQVAAAAYLVQDLQSGRILAGKDLDTQIEPASLTKLMTAYLTFKALEEGVLKPDQELLASQAAWRAEGSRMFVNLGKPVSVSDLLKGLIVQSGNDAAIILAEALGGTEAGFADKMNVQAQQLGMKNTRFINATGLPGEGHLTTVRDLALLSAAIIRDYPQYYPIYSMKSFKYNNIDQPNRNLLLYRDPSVDGLKTGHTASAGYNLIASSNRNGRRVLSVVVGTDSPEARAAESSKLLNWALQSFDTLKAYQAGQTVSQVKLYKGAANTVAVGFLDDAYLTFSRGSSKDIRPVLETVQPVLAPVSKGQVLGKLKIMSGGQEIESRDVVALNDVGEAGWFGRVYDSIVLWFKQMFAD
ncbi:D-alanyl-D-alanine carboxypeptidase family protein [Neisseria leonii]|uniref:D-alanyl-D-alanine carboxypeptidase family protein n=1 Tax=Neisseria leonii TaxID=2995413 RepID=UPI00237B86C9|nr:D-alanyl-D-alanine carboxypeptidase family protein [Neisseria sp. 3986]MDD9326322.1 D-alanyl-D-alanine carboxypeptidase [Neisseria sp. 3986]